MVEWDFLTARQIWETDSDTKKGEVLRDGKRKGGVMVTVYLPIAITL